MRLDQLDDSLLEGARAGDRRALRELVDALRRPVYNLALRMLPTAAEAEEATQEALLKIVTGLSTFEGHSRLSTWAWTVASRTLLDYRKGQHRRPLYSIEEFQESLADCLDEEARERPEDRILLGQLKIACARALLQTLDAEHRLAFILGEILEVPGPDAARIAEVGEPTFRKRLSRARARLYPALQAHCGVVEPRARCRCHRRLDRARELGRVPEGAPDPGLDVAALRAALAEIEDLAARGAAYYRSHPLEDSASVQDQSEVPATR